MRHHFCYCCLECAGNAHLQRYLSFFLCLQYFSLPPLVRFVKFLFHRLVVFVMDDKHMFTQIRSTHVPVGIYDPLFVAADADRSDYVHMVLRALQR